MKDDDRIGSLIGALERTPIASILTTPLMVALVVVRFRIEESIPRNEINFYSDLFDLLVRRHDQWKSGYTRHRQSQLGDSQLRNVFDGISFFWKKEKLAGEFTREDLQRLAATSLRIINSKEKADDVIEDISKITCLLLEDNGYVKFAHKSIQEFYAASFIRTLPDSNASQFFDSMRTEWLDWPEEVRYLKDIDFYRFTKFFFVPECTRVLGVTVSKMPVKWTPQATILNDFIGHCLRKRSYVFSKIVDRITLRESERRDRKGFLVVTAFINSSHDRRSYGIDIDTMAKVHEVKSFNFNLLPEKTRFAIMYSAELKEKYRLPVEAAFREVFFEFQKAANYLKDTDNNRYIFKITP